MSSELRVLAIEQGLFSCDTEIRNVGHILCGGTRAGIQNVEKLLYYVNLYL